MPERARFCCLGERSRRLPPTYCPQGVLLMLDLLLAFDRLLLSGKALPFVAALAVLVLIGGTIFQFPLAIFDCSCYDTGRNRMCKKYSA